MNEKEAEVGPFKKNGYAILNWAKEVEIAKSFFPILINLPGK